MSRSLLPTLFFAAALLGAAPVLGACNANASTGGPGNGPATGGGSGAAPGDVGTSGGSDGGAGDVSSEGEGGVAPGPPSIVTVGRFDDGDPGGKRFAWPGSRIVARFAGTGATVRLTQVDGYSGGPTWFNVIVDGQLGAPFPVSAGAQEVTLATGLPSGAHVVEIEKRTEANLGTVRFEGFAFTGGAGLLAPPTRPSRHIEFLADSTIDGFGVEGDLTTTCKVAGVAAAPARYDDVRKSTAAHTASALDAEAYVLAYSGKGLTTNESPSDTDMFVDLYDRTLPDAPFPWSFAAWTADVVVISLGGTDFDAGLPTPPGFATKYGELVDKVRAHYPSAHVYMTVWAQIKDEPVPTRTAMTTALEAVLAARSGDKKLHVFAFTEASPANETGCYGHANDAEHEAAAAELAARIRADLGW